VAREPFVLAIASHKGGTGRTTAACALAWLWGQAGIRVALADVDPVRAARLIATEGGDCPWDNVRYFDRLPDTDSGAELVVVDCPSLMDPTIDRVLRNCHSVVLTCVADPLSLRTVPSAARVLATARVSNPRLELLGVLIGLYNSLDVIQAPMLGKLRQMHGDLLINPPIPYDPEIRDWAAFEPAAKAGYEAMIAALDRLTTPVTELRRHTSTAEAAPTPRPVPTPA